MSVGDEFHIYNPIMMMVGIMVGGLGLGPLCGYVMVPLESGHTSVSRRKAWKFFFLID